MGTERAGTKHDKDGEKNMAKSPKQKIQEITQVAAEGAWSTRIKPAKSKLIEEMIPFLEPRRGESKEEMKQRLLGQTGKGGLSNKKILKLHRIVTRLRDEFQGERNNLINTLMEAQRGKKSGKVNEDYRKYLEKKSTATLFLQYDHAKKAGEL